MNEIVTGIIATVVAGVILAWLGLNRSTTVVQVGGRPRKSRKWKTMIVVGWILTVFGGYYALAWGIEKGLNNYHTGLGISLFAIGIPILLLGRFGSWWSRD